MSKKKVTSPNVTAPIIQNARTLDDVQPLLDFIRDFQRRDNTSVARKEAFRLKPYFDSMSSYLTKEMKQLPPGKGYNKKKLKILATPKGLCKIFNEMAAFSRNTLISDVVILPDNIGNTGPAQHHFNSMEFNPSFGKKQSYELKFGFLQIFKKKKKGESASSITFPTFMINTKNLDRIRPYDALPLLGGLQAVMTFVNHDMLHHFTSPLLNSSIADKLNGFGYDDTPEYKWRWSLPRNTIGAGGYEEWAHAGHEKIVLSPTNAKKIAATEAQVAKFFDELNRISKKIMEEPGGDDQYMTRQKHELTIKAHEVVDYFGMVMAHSLSRIFPLNHPVMTACFKRLEKIDPLSQSAAREYAEKLGHKNITNDKELMRVIRKTLKNDDNLEIIREYKKLKHHIFPHLNAKVGYKHIKQLQLIAISPDDVRAHVPTSAPIRDVAGKATLQMLVAADKTVKMKLKSPK